MRLSYESLKWRTKIDNPDEIADFEPPVAFFGQGRAKDALDLTIKGGFHAYLVGPSSLGKHESLLKYLETLSVETPPDLLYVPLSERKAGVLTLPSGQENALAESVDDLLAESGRLESLFRQGAFLREKSRLEQEIKDSRNGEMSALRSEAQEAGFALSNSGDRLEFTGPGEIPAELNARLEEVALSSLAAVAEYESRLRRLRRDWSHSYLQSRTEPLIKRFPSARQYLENLRDRMVRFGETGEPFNPLLWRPNLLTSSNNGNPPPIVYEPYATAPRLFGKLDFTVEGGVWATHVGLIRVGSVHRAQGGFLVVDAASLIHEGTWAAFSRALKSGQIEPVTEGEAPSSLEIEPFPLQMQVILVGSHEAFDHLAEDPIFYELFRIRVEFASSLPATSDTLESLGGYLKEYSFESTRGGLAELYDESRRMNEHRDRLDARLVEIRALAEEAAVLGEGIVTQESVQKAIKQRDSRAFLSEEEFLRAVKEKIWHLKTDGKAIGEANSLVVVETMAGWGRPVRLTAKAGPGRDHLISIDREAGLAGQIFHKAVLTLSAYLRSRYAPQGGFTASVSLAFEQNYVPIDGDSAGVAELLTTLSVLGGFPLRQDLAVTGSVDQNGMVQAVGGVSAKIEGFYRVCKLQGLTGKQGVIIPKSNIGNLTLEEELLDAVKAQKFHIYAVETVDEALEILSGLRPEGFRGAHALVEKGLQTLAKLDHDEDKDEDADEEE